MIDIREKNIIENLDCSGEAWKLKYLRGYDMFASGGNNECINIWDLRKMEKIESIQVN